MSLIIQCWYCTEENGKFKYAKPCVESLMQTVDLTKHRLVIIDQNSCAEAKEFLSWLSKKEGITVITLSENIGTAKGINIGLRMRQENETCIKCDEDLTWESSGWVDEMEAEILKNTNIGILGLKRDDVYGEMRPEGNLLWCHDIFGTCTMLNPLLIDKIGYYYTPGLYGFDDSLISVRSEAAGFKNAFMKDIKIVNLDVDGTPYTEWKKKEAGIYLQEVGIMMEMIKKGELTYQYEGE